MKTLLSITTLCLMIAFIGCKTKELTPEQQAKTEAFTKKVEARKFTFHATTALPTSGKNVNLNYNYYLKVSNDTVIANLPYYGRSYVAPMDATDIGVDFTSTNFGYTSEKKSNGSYEIKIEPKDISKEPNQGISLSISISPNGYGTVNTTFSNRESISYYGTVD